MILPNNAITDNSVMVVQEVVVLAQVQIGFLVGDRLIVDLEGIVSQILVVNPEGLNPEADEMTGEGREEHQLRITANPWLIGTGKFKV